MKDRLKEQEAAIRDSIEANNFLRAKLLFFGLLIVEILFIVLVDLPNLANTAKVVIWSDHRYFTIHFLLLTTALAGIVIANQKATLFYHIFFYGIIIIILSLTAILNGLDQIKIGQTNSVFIANLLIVSAVISIRFPVNLLIFLAPFSIFIGGLLIFQKNEALLYSNIINGIIVLIAVIILSKTIYDSQYAQISKTIMLEEANRKLDYLSKHDPLTGLSNRRYFEIQMQQKLEVLQPDQGAAVLILVDIDCFKKINDQYGHPVGDMVIKEVSNILSANIKANDLVARWGGEEFLILLYQTSIDEAYQAANKLRMIIEKHNISIDKVNLNITASFGIAPFDILVESLIDAYRLADQALYQAKDQGKNQVVAIS